MKHGTVLRFNPLTPGAFCKKCFFGHFGGFQAASRPNQLQSGRKCICNTTSCLSCYWHRVLQHFNSCMRRNQNFEIVFGGKSNLSLQAFRFLEFFSRLSFFCFSLLFAAVIDLLLGLPAVKKLLGKRHRDGQFSPWSSQVQWQQILVQVFRSTF